MKTKNLKTNDKLLTLYCLSYVFKYLRCIIVQAQMEQEALRMIALRRSFNSQKLLHLNLKHNKLAKSLHDQKMKIENCA